MLRLIPAIVLTFALIQWRVALIRGRPGFWHWIVIQKNNGYELIYFIALLQFGILENLVLSDWYWLALPMTLLVDAAIVAVTYKRLPRFERVTRCGGAHRASRSGPKSTPGS